MKKVVVISIIIAVAAPVFAVVAVETDFFKSVEAEKTAVEKKIDTSEVKKNIKFPIKTMKMQKINIDREKFRKNMQKKKEKREEKPNFKKKRESYGG